MKHEPGVLKELYRTMVRIRHCEESLVEPILRGEVVCPCHLYSGQEAVAAGICKALSRDDYIFGNHRSHGHFLAKGCDMGEMVAEIYGRETGCSRGRGGSMHLIDPGAGMLGSAPIVAGTISLAMGAALAASIRQDNRVALSFFGDGATGEGVLYECLNFAALRKLPMIFVCENNLYATHMPIRECRIESGIHKVGDAFCISNCVVDGNDVLQVYEACSKAVEQCRNGGGPSFIECLTYRFRGHVGPDDNIQGSHTDIRPREEIEWWLDKDPIKRFERHLLVNRLFEAQELNEIKREAETEVTEAHRFAKNSPRPDRKDMKSYVFK
ncbi:MAG: thiamine pyrophosphate-dependent dehydrogenase E1 component subunit alpha [Syntrophobacteraceae bacterium]|nr:thiamine pyrophosphate-dependent dehydrogenase E1 component subunit alpha [Syntrophobacteraceae bacterium]